MKLLHWKVVEKLEEIPKSTENRSVDAIEGIENFGAPEVGIHGKSSVAQTQWI